MKYSVLNSNILFKHEFRHVTIPVTTLVHQVRSKRKSLSAQRPKSCDMLGYNDITSNVASRSSEVRSIMLRILRIKSSVSLMHDGAVGKYGLRKKSTISDIPSVAEPHTETTDLLGTRFNVPLE